MITILNATFPVVPVADLVYREGGFILQTLPAVLLGCDGVWLHNPLTG